MNLYRIRINDLPYMGIDPENTYGDCTTDAFSSNSFHTRRQELEIVVLGNRADAPKAIIGDITLKSELEKIIRRSQAGVFQIKSILIVSEDGIKA